MTSEFRPRVETRNRRCGLPLPSAAERKGEGRGEGSLAAGSDSLRPGDTSLFWEEILAYTPESKVRRTLQLAAQIPVALEPEVAAKVLGNGSLVTAPDTVPFALWCAARHPDDFKRALAAAIQTGGDCDTNAAIVGGIVALSVGAAGIPADWLDAREPLSFRNSIS